MAKKFTSKSDNPQSKMLSASVLASTEGWVVALVSTEKLLPNPSQPRKIISDEDLEMLAASIKTKGILQPLVAVPNPDTTYTIIAGHRRHKAAQLLGLTEVPVYLRETPPGEFLEIALIENQQRSNLHPVEEIWALKEMERIYQTHEKAADAAHMKRPTFSNKVRFAALGNEILAMCLQISDLSYRQLERLLSFPEGKRLQVVQQWTGTTPKKAGNQLEPPKKLNPFRIMNKEKGNTYTIEFKPKKKNATLVDFAEALRKTLQDVETQIAERQALES
ncbi:MAG: ParB/RepB/Spo0J family partition protein [Blastocatellia bacterium]|nr:ParB/RepB/Spo0J family partition protein [Blastocatellia bacterium]